MEEVGSTRLSSLEHVTTGVGSVSRATHIEADSHGRLLRPMLPEDVFSVIFSPEIHYLLDSKLTQITDKVAILPQVKWYKFYAQNVEN